MKNRITNSVKSLLASLLLSLLLSGCNEIYQQPDYGYDPGYGGVSDRHMVNNCKLQVENKVSRKLGYDARIDFGYVDVSDISRYQSRVRGDAYTSDRSKRLRFDYRCTLETDNGRVTDVKLDWRNKPGNGGGKGNAASACKSHISKKVQRETSTRVSIDFRKHDSKDMSGKRRKVTGKAHVISNRGSGKIAYECVVDTGYMKVDNAHYRWTQNLPPGEGHSGHDRDKAKRKCHKAIGKKLGKNGYTGMEIKSTKFSAVGSSDLLVTGKMNTSYQGKHKRARYECRADGRNGNIKSADYRLGHK